MTEEFKRAADVVERIVHRSMPISDYDAAEIARATLLAIREPTPEMVKAANRTGNSHAADKWRAMVDYILGSGT